MCEKVCQSICRGCVCEKEYKESKGKNMKEDRTEDRMKRIGKGGRRKKGLRKKNGEK